MPLLAFAACTFPDVYYASDADSVDASALSDARGPAADAELDARVATDSGTPTKDAGFQVVLGAASRFAVLAGTTVTNSGASTIAGDLGVAPGTAITGITPGMVSGTLHPGDAIASQAQQALTSAYNLVRQQGCTMDLTGGDLGGLTLQPGVYCFPTSGANLSGTLTLDAQGNPDAVFLFQIAQALTTSALSQIRVVHGGSACKVHWQVGSSATLGAASTFVGSVLAATSITLSAGVLVTGRALARNGAVTMDSADVSTTSCVE